MMKHLDVEDAEALVNGELGVLRSLRCRLHLKRCSECRRIVAECREDRHFLTEVSAAAEVFEQPEEKALSQHLIARLEEKQNSR